jgi:hypothetical protein
MTMARKRSHMRKALAARQGERATFHGTFERLGTKNGWQGRQDQTVLLTEVCDATGTPVCDHLWFNLTKAFALLRLQPGDIVQFDARVKKYLKGYFGRREEVYRPAEVDYKLSHPTRVKKRDPAA